MPRFAECVPLLRKSGALRASPGWARTVDTYVNEFVAFTGEPRLEMVQSAQLLEWAGRLFDEGLTRQTVKNKTGAIAAIMSAAHAAGLVETLIPAPRVSGRKVVRTRILSQEEEELLIALLRWKGLWSALYATVALVDTGARLGSLWGAWDLDTEARRVLFHVTKNGVPYEVGLTARALISLQALRSLPWPSIRTYQRQFKLAGVDMGIPETDKEFVPHMLRHTCATRLVAAGMDLKKVQAHLGHEDIKQTARYTKVRGATLNEIADVLNQSVLSVPLLEHRS